MVNEPEETPKRLKPKSNVTRDLYLASGNRCAYPGCDRPLMGADGVLVGEIAHIEGALPDSARFNREMTNEQRRAYANLILMCGSDHTVIDEDEVTWTVEVLQKLKEAHEAVYLGAVDQLRRQIGDVTEDTLWLSPTNLQNVPRQGQLTPAELTESIKLVDQFAARLAGLPIGTRSILAIIVHRGELTWGGSTREVAIPFSLLKGIVDCEEAELWEHLEIIENSGLGYLDQPFSGDIQEYVVGNSTSGFGWELLADVKTIADGDPRVVRQILRDLDFTPLGT